MRAPSRTAAAAITVLALGVFGLGLASKPLAAASTPTASSALRLVIEPQDDYTSIYQLISSARRSLDLVIYELRDNHAEQLLAGDARRGVAVRVLLDHDNLGSYNQAALNYLAADKVAVRWASSRVEITHEKAFVVDESTAVVMTGNLTSQYYSSTRDFAVVDQNPRDVAAIETTFAIDWTNGTAQPPSGRDLVWSPGSEGPLVALISSARKSLLVENEEMSDRDIIDALIADAHRGVLVKVVMTRSSELAPVFDELVAAGVHVHSLAASASLYIHAKVIVVDNEQAFVGSENFSVTSLQYNRELGLITADASIVAQLSATLDSDYAAGTAWSA